MLTALSESTFMDSRLLAAGDTLIRFREKKSLVTVPSYAGNLILNKIGPGAVIAQGVTRLNIGEGYTRLSGRAILGYGDLSALMLPASLEEAETDFVVAVNMSRILVRRQLDEQELAVLTGVGIPIAKGHRILAPGEFTSPALRVLTTAALCLAPAAPLLSPEMHVLFEANSPSDSIFSPVGCYDLTGSHTSTEEYSAVMDMIGRGRTGWRHPEAEKKNDYWMRVKNPSRSVLHPLSLIIFKEPPSLLPRGKRAEIIPEIIKTRLFTPSLLPILHEGTQYYLYSRNHLTGSEECPYYREDMGVFTVEGLVTDRKISEAVYAKARFIMLL